MSAFGPKQTSISSSLDYSRLCDILTGSKIGGIRYNVESAANPASVGIYRNVCVCSRICAEDVMRAGLRGPLQECGQELVHSGLHGKVLPKAQREKIALGFRP
jgi:hypothetical protein